MSDCAKLLVRPKEAAEMLSVSEDKLAELGVRPSYRGNRLTLYDRRELQRIADVLALQAGLADIVDAA